MESKNSRGRGRALYAPALFALALCVFALLPAMASASVPNTALINAESVTFDDGIEKEGQPISLEQFAAEQAGFSVTVRSAAEWEAMSAAEFAHYQVLVVGDPDCGESATSAVNSAPVWAPVVMGSEGGGAGNRVVVGTDPEDHYAFGEGGAAPTNPADPTTAGAEHLVQRGIGFAGAVPGATGVYFDTSCDDSGGDVGVFNMLKAPGATGEWQEDPEGPRCESPVVQIATNPAFHSGPNPLTNNDISGWECSSHVTFLSFPSDWTALAIATPVEGEIRPTPVCGSDIENPTIERCGAAYVLIAGSGIVAKAPNLSLEPETHSDIAGGQHTVVANAHKEGKPIVGLPVSFVVTETNAGVAGTCTTTSGAADPECKTDENGNVLFTYGDVHGVGKDTIVGSITLENTIEEQIPEAQPGARTVTTTERATATEEWTPAPAPAPAPAVTVLPAKAAKAPAGKASVASVRGCIAQASYTASVHGSSMQTVKFVLDGHTVKTVHVKSGATKASARIAVRSGSKHHLTIKVGFTSASGTAAKTFHRTLARCAARRVEPRFTG